MGAVSVGYPHSRCTPFVFFAPYRFAHDTGESNDSSHSHRLLFQMRLVITQDYDAMAEWSARYIRKRINDFKPSADRLFVLGLPTGM